MKFKKEIKIIIEGEVFDNSDPVEIFKKLKFSWRHWWEKNPNWIYGKPSDYNKKGILEKIFIEEEEIENQQF